MTADGLKAELREAVDVEVAREYEEARNTALENSLNEVFDVIVPETLVDNQSREKFSQMLAEMRSSGQTNDEDLQKMVTAENMDKYKAIAKPGLTKSIRINMALEAIAKLEGVKVSEEEMSEQLGSLAKQAEKEGGEFDEESLRPRVESALLRKLVFDVLAEKADLVIEYKTPEQVEAEGGGPGGRGGGEFDEKLMDDLMRKQEEEERKQAAVRAAAAEEAGGP